MNFGIVGALGVLVVQTGSCRSVWTARCRANVILTIRRKNIPAITNPIATAKSMPTGISL
jgi:hypothetical protein